MLAFTRSRRASPCAILLHRVHGNPVTRIFQTLSSFWIGLAIHLVFFLALGWAVHGVSRLLGRPLSVRFAVSVAIALALSASLYGLWQAKHPVVKSLEVEIGKELPESWEGRTVVQLSDVHLGYTEGAS